MPRKDFNATARARRFVAQSSVTKKLDKYQKDKLVRGISTLLNEAYDEGNRVLNA